MSVSVQLAKHPTSQPLLSLHELRREAATYAERAGILTDAAEAEPTTDGVALCAYELALNAWLYAPGPHTVTLDVVGAEMRVTVSDGSVTPVPLGDESALDDDSDRGRGLRLVTALSSAQELRLERGKGKAVRACWTLPACVAIEPVTVGVLVSLPAAQAAALRART